MSKQGHKIRPFQYQRCHVQNPMNMFKQFKHMDPSFKRVWTVWNLNGLVLKPVWNDPEIHICIHVLVYLHMPKNITKSSNDPSISKLFSETWHIQSQSRPPYPSNAAAWIRQHLNLTAPLRPKCHLGWPKSCQSHGFSMALIEIDGLVDLLIAWWFFSWLC